MKLQHDKRDRTSTVTWRESRNDLIRFVYDDDTSITLKKTTHTKFEKWVDMMIAKGKLKPNFKGVQILNK